MAVDALNRRGPQPVEVLALVDGPQLVEVVGLAAARGFLNFFAEGR